MRPPLRCVLVLVCALSAAGLPAQVTSLRVLFLGNSLTDGNNVPALVQAMAQLQGVRLEYAASAPGGYALEDHWSDGHQFLLQTGSYNVLVLQQGPSTLPESQVNLRDWAMAWANEARKYGTQPALYMIWPVRTQAGGFGLVSMSYRNAALAASASIFPAGEVWQQVLNADPTIQLYSSDDLHATPAGSFLAAMVIARGLVSLDPNRVPESVNGITVSASTLTRFRTAVAALPAETLGELPGSSIGGSVVGPETVAPIPITPAPVSITTPATTPAKKGGGASSHWFLIALIVAATVRLLERTRPRRARIS